MDRIPENYVFNKGVTGCGATTLAIKQPGHTILAVPFVDLILNKVAQHQDVLLGIHGPGNKTAKIAEYLATHPTVKIMTTYDSLPKVNSILAKLGINPCEETHVVIDE